MHVYNNTEICYEAYLSRHTYENVYIRDIEINAVEVSEDEQTPSDDLKRCMHCGFETKSDDDLEKHM